MVKGSSKHPAVRRTVAVVHFLMFRFNISIWWEFVDSKANWSDGVSRWGAEDKCAREHGFTLTQLQTPRRWWDGTLQEQWDLVQSCGGT